MSVDKHATTSKAVVLLGEKKGEDMTCEEERKGREDVLSRKIHMGRNIRVWR